jgi:hypothetical protein
MAIIVFSLDVASQHKVLVCLSQHPDAGLSKPAPEWLLVSATQHSPDQKSWLSVHKGWNRQKRPREKQN